MTTRAIFFEVGGWLIMACLALIVVLLFLKLIQRFRFIFRVLDYLAMPGTIVHELGHYVVCRIYGFRVDSVKWFHWGYMLNYERAFHETGGNAGQVRFTGAASLSALFLVGAAPLLSGGLFWFLSIVGVHLLLAQTSPFARSLSPFYETIAITFLLWVGLASAARMLPSSRDMQNVLDCRPDNPMEGLIRLIAWSIRSINGLLRNYHKGVRVWSVVTTLTTLYVLLKFSIPGGQAYLEPFGIIATAIRDFAEAAKEIN